MGMPEKKKLKRIDGRKPAFGFCEIHDGRHKTWCKHCNKWRYDQADKN